MYPVRERADEEEREKMEKMKAERIAFTYSHLLVSLQLLNEGALVEECLQTFLGVVMA